MAKTTEVIVSTESIENFNDMILELGNKTEELVQRFSNEVKLASTNAVISGDAHKEMELYYSFVEELRAQFRTIAKKTRSTNKDFVAKVDIDDKFLY